MDSWDCRGKKAAGRIVPWMGCVFRSHQRQQQLWISQHQGCFRTLDTHPKLEKNWMKIPTSLKMVKKKWISSHKVIKLFLGKYLIFNSQPCWATQPILKSFHRGHNTAPGSTTAIFPKRSAVLATTGVTLRLTSFVWGMTQWSGVSTVVEGITPSVASWGGLGFWWWWWWFWHWWWWWWWWWWWIWIWICIWIWIWINLQHRHYGIGRWKSSHHCRRQSQIHIDQGNQCSGLSKTSSFNPSITIHHPKITQRPTFENQGTPQKAAL